MTDQPEATLVAVDGRDALAYVLIRPGATGGTVTAEAGARGLSKPAAAHILRGIAAKWDSETEVTIPIETAAHVLWTEALGGWPPSTFATKLLSLWTSADTDHAARLAVAFPEYAAAIALVKSGQDGIQQLRAIAGDS
ncbi:hypothetical protein ACWDVX_22170 [Streptomyces tendae]